MGQGGAAASRPTFSDRRGASAMWLRLGPKKDLVTMPWIGVPGHAVRSVFRAHPRRHARGRTMATTTTTKGNATIPATMTAAAIDRFGGPDVLKLHTLPVPSIADNEVLIALHTAGVGVWEAAMRSEE